MAVAIEGTPADIDYGNSSGSTTYTAETGSNRVVVFTMKNHDFFDLTFAPKMGAVSFVEGDFINGQDRMLVGIWYILEANIPSSSNVIDYGENDSFDNGFSTLYTLSGVDQSSTGVFTNFEGATTAPSVSLTGVTDGFALAVGGHDLNGALAVDSGWTTGRLINNVGMFQNKVTTSGADTWAPTSTSTRDWGCVVGVFNPVGGAAEEFLGRQYPQGVMRGVMRGAA